MIDATVDDLTEGTIIDDRYVIVRFLAQGSMGRTYVGRQLNLDRKVAIKILDPQTTETDRSSFEERFRREAAALARFPHPNVVQVIDHGVHAGLFFLVMEYVDGVSLSDLLDREGRLPLDLCLHIGRQLCAALAAPHAAGVVHRDIKPANVLLSRQGKEGFFVKLLDFGLVKDLRDRSDLTEHGTMLGTPHYMSPEQCMARDADISPRADVYSIGMILFRAVAGRRPFQGLKGVAVLMAHVKNPCPSVREVAPDLQMPDALDWTIARCAEKQPSLRFANASELDRALAVCQRALKHPGQAVEVSLDNGQVISPSLQADDGSMSLVAPSLTRRLGAWSENTPLSTANVKNGSIGSDADWLDRDITVEPAADDAASSELDSGTSEVSSIVLPANRATPGWGTKAAVAALMIAAAGWAITSLQATPRTEAPPVVVTLPTLAAAAAPVVQAAPAPSAVAAVTPSTVAPAPSQLTESAASSTAAVDSDTKQAAPAKPKPAVAEKKPAPKPAPKPQAAAPKPAAPAPTKPAAAQPAAASPWVTKPEPKPRNDLKNPFQK